MKDTFIPDASQQEVIDVDAGYHLVLAPPGCGKTQILTERIRKAHQQGVLYEDMLCLTFTNRAARGMQERIHENIDDEDVGRVFVGNVHRFCSKFLYDAGIIPAETSIIDEEDAISILSRYTEEDEYMVASNYNKRNEYFEYIFLSHFMYQIRNGHPKDLRLHTECINSDDIKAMRTICRIQRMDFDAKAMVDIYDHYDLYMDISHSDAYDVGAQKIIRDLLRKMRFAHQFENYKKENNLIDFEDLLLLAYDALKGHVGSMPEGTEIKRYSWIQIDEVQDLNPMQLAIIDNIYAAEEKSVILYLGDEHQAIFSFMGAKLSTLDFLKTRCDGHIHQLSTNHRSPKYLLDIYNHYAAEVLKIDKALLPSTTYEPTTMGNELVISQSTTIECEFLDAAQIAQHLEKSFPEDTTAIIVNSNKDADSVSNELTAKGIQHFKVSGDDLFSSPGVKLLFSHLAILDNENNFIAWARLLKGLHVFEANSSSRNFVRTCMNKAMLPLDFLQFKDSTYIQAFAEAYENEEIVIFDTETTGLDVFNDDILQIAAVKIRRGEVVPGSELSLYIETDKEIPAMLGDIVNPIVEERKTQQLLPHDVALQKFLEYVGNAVLLGHNADYDINILKNNLKRYLPAAINEKLTPSLRENRYFDTLRLVRRLEPTLRQYKLKFLLEQFHLEGENSHLADADVNATRSVVNYCYQKAKEFIPLQQKFMREKKVISRVEILRRNYQEIYNRSIIRLYTLGTSVVGELKDIYDILVEEDILTPIPLLHYITSYLSNDLIDEANEPALITQLQHHFMEMNTLKEADLCNSSTINDKVFVTTVHKAKGLEFDNVIIFDAIEGRYPNYFSQNNPQMVAEDARKFYVAMTRAKKRLIVMQSTVRMDYHNQPQPRHITRFMRPLLNRFEVRSLKDVLQG